MAGIFWHSLSAKEAQNLLASDIERGLSEKEVAIRQRKFGKNLLPKEKPLSSVRIFLSQFTSPLIYILLSAGIIALILKNISDASIIFIAVFLNALVGFLQENKATKTLASLRDIVEQKTKARREGNLKIIDSKELVPGDIIILNLGDKVPSDARIIESHELMVNEMILTGEWLNAQKQSEVLLGETPLADRDNMLYMGTTIERGNGQAVVIATGLQSEIGKIAKTLKETKEGKTPYQNRLARFSMVIGVIIVLVSLGIFIEGMLTGGKFIEMLTTAVAVTVAAIPEGLPVAMTVILALGMERILKEKGLVRKLASAETLGSTSVIAVDKTATLTEGKMKIDQVLGDNLTLKAAFATSQAFVENPADVKKNWIIRGEATDIAFLSGGLEAGFKKADLGEIEAELFFSHQNKFAAVLYKENGGKRIIYASGAPEKIFELCKLSEKEKTEKEEELDVLTRRGLRVVATAYQDDIREISGKLENIRGLVFAGFITLKDPIRKDVKEAMETCRQAGMRVIIITGDHRLTAKAVAEELGMKVEQDNILEGKDLDLDGVLERKLDKIKIYARVEPMHKLKIIEAWQKRGEVVAMTGDGVNDAPALKKADIGIALGSGTAVAKETADLVLLNDSFSTIVAAVQEGRKIIDNIRKVITYLLADSFTEIILIGVSLFLGLPLPVLAAQILWINLIEDGPLGIALAFEPKENDLMKHPPLNRKNSLLTGEMRSLIFIIGIITDFFLLGLFFWLFNYSNYEIPHIRSIIFVGLAIDSIFFIFSCKSLRNNIWRTNIFSNKFLIFSWIFSCLALLSAVYLPPLQYLLKTTPLNFFDWQLILGLALSNMVLIEATKWYFINKGKNRVSAA